MTKHILRIIVTIAVLAAVGLCLWFFVFKPTDTETTFALLKDLNTYKETSGYSSNLEKIAGYDNGSCYTDSTLADRYRIFGAGDVTIAVVDPSNAEATIQVDSFYKNYNYATVISSLDDIYSVYASYTLFAEDVSNSEMNAVEDKVNAYESAIANVVASTNNLIEYESICKSAGDTITDGLKAELANRYADFAAKYKVAFSSYYDLIIVVQDLVKEKTFGGEFVYDAQTSYLDIMLMLDSAFLSTTVDSAETIQGTPVSETDLTLEQIALKKACLTSMTYDSYNATTGGWIDEVGSTSVSDFLSAYLATVESYGADLSRATNAHFNFFAIEGLKTDGLGEGSVEGYAPSNISTTAKPYLKTMLTFCGIMVLEG